MKVGMKQLQQCLIGYRRGFLLIELLVVMLILSGTIGALALYQARIHNTYHDVLKRNRAVNAAQTVLETMRYKKQVPATTKVDDITITTVVRTIQDLEIAVPDNVTPSAHKVQLVYVEVQASWPSAHGTPDVLRLSSCIRL